MFILFLILLTACSSENNNTKENIKYVTFTLNTHDWVYPEKSVETVERILDIHEKYNVKLDIYLTDPMIQLYTKEHPEVMKRLLKDSNLVAINYHVRPPSPYYENFDWLGLSKMDDNILYNTLLDYEEHEIDLSTGKTTTNPGGYEYLKEIIGYPPIITSPLAAGNIEKEINKIFKEKGATFTIAHGIDSPSLGQKKDGLYIKPETADILLYEYLGAGESSAEIMKNETKGESGDPFFVAIKMHENNFYSNTAPWRLIVYKDEKSHGIAGPPFNHVITDEEEAGLLHTDQESEEMWQMYEDMVKYVSKHPEQFKSINAFDLKEMI